MLSTLLRCSTRRAWRGLGRAKEFHVAVESSIARQSCSVLSARSFSSTPTDSGDKSTDQSSALDGSDKDKAGGKGRRSLIPLEEKVLAAVRVYKDLNGDTIVPRSFVVPSGDPRWPQIVWGYTLGTAVNAFRGRVQKGEVSAWATAELKKLEFVERVWQYRWDEIVLPSLQVYRQENGHCIVEGKFKVPARPPWPDKAWGEPLGVVVADIRSGKIYVEQAARDHDMLDQLGFAWDYYLWTWNERIFPAMEAYVNKHGHCRIPMIFVVPKQYPWPKNVWGMALGRSRYSMKHRGTYFAIIGRDVNRLQKLGFSFELSDCAWKKLVGPLLDLHGSIFGDKQVPHDFVVPPEAPWPKAKWGVALGFIVARNTQHMS